MSDDQQVARAGSRVIVTLVHGTWAHIWRSKWYEDGSPFVETLRRTFKGVDLHLMPFSWSGANSIYARRDGADKLAGLVSASLDQFPDEQHLIVGHSHGGNVALKALEIIGSKGRRVRVVAVATPFLRVYRNSLSSRFRVAWIAVYTPWLLLALANAVYFGMLMIGSVYHDGWIKTFSETFFNAWLAGALMMTILFTIPLTRHCRGLINNRRGI